MTQRKVTVVALVGSPRKRGNTDIMTDELLAGARDGGAETFKIYLDDYDVRPIAEVSDNSRLRDDTRSSDDFHALLEQCLHADVVVWSTPVYWYGVAAQMKCFLDRMSCYFNHPEYVNRFTGKGHVVLCAYGRREPRHARWVTDPMKMAATTLHGTYLGDVCVSVYEKGRVREAPEVLDACRKLGAEVARSARPGSGWSRVSRCQR